MLFCNLQRVYLQQICYLIKPYIQFDDPNYDVLTVQLVSKDSNTTTCRNVLNG